MGELTVFAPEEQKVELNKPFKPTVDAVLENVIVMECHAGRNPETDEWHFQDGQSIVDVVEGYSKLAQEMDLPELEFVIACNREVIPECIELGVLVKDIPVEYEIVQQVGDVMASPMRNSWTIPKDGYSRYTVHPMNGEFWGLKDLIDKKMRRGEAKRVEERAGRA